jgi:hypothetical protein
MRTVGLIIKNQPKKDDKKEPKNQPKKDDKKEPKNQPKKDDENGKVQE